MRLARVCLAARMARRPKIEYLHLFVEVFAHFVIGFDLRCVGVTDLRKRIQYRAIFNDGTAAHDLKVTLFCVHDYVKNFRRFQISCATKS